MEENHGNNKRYRAAKDDDDEDDGEPKPEINNNQMRPWHLPSSRIFRVSRASGGKDRHSKVYTSKGLRDRRVRLSVSTAIQFYDLQDRLGYDQPSKAIEWLIKAASSAIAELPTLDHTNFPHPFNMMSHQQQVDVEKSDSVVDPEADPSYNQQQQSSNSETSKGSVLSLSRSESRVKARERARERAKDKDRDDHHAHVVSHHQRNVVDPGFNSQESFTKLLTDTAQASSSTASFIQKQMQNLTPVTSTANYFSTQSCHFGQQQQQQPSPHQKTTAQFGMLPLMNSGSSEHPMEMQQFPFEHFFPVSAAVAAANAGDYNLNFASFHREPLQSNSPSDHHQLHLSHNNHHHHQNNHTHHLVPSQRFSLALEGSSVPLFFGAPVTTAVAPPTENPFSLGFDGNLQLYNGYKHLELKGKGKS